jgi:hypothetical protein
MTTMIVISCPEGYRVHGTDEKVCPASSTCCETEQVGVYGCCPLANVVCGGAVGAVMHLVILYWFLPWVLWQLQ